MTILQIENLNLLILSLIKANMCNNKLILGLENAGLKADDFHGDLETIILKLMGFDLKNPDVEYELYEFYYETMNHLLQIEVQDFRKNLDRLAEEMFIMILRKK